MELKQTGSKSAQWLPCYPFHEQRKTRKTLLRKRLLNLEDFMIFKLHQKHSPCLGTTSQTSTLWLGASGMPSWFFGGFHFQARRCSKQGWNSCAICAPERQTYLPAPNHPYCANLVYQRHPAPLQNCTVISDCHHALCPKILLEHRVFNLNAVMVSILSML